MANLNVAMYSHKEHLGQFYQDLSQLNTVDSKVLEKLCADGVADIVKKTQADSLQSAGVLVYQSKGYWLQGMNRLNY